MPKFLLWKCGSKAWSVSLRMGQSGGIPTVDLPVIIDAVFAVGRVLCFVVGKLPVQRQ